MEFVAILSLGWRHGTDFVRIRDIFYSVQQVKLTTVWELRKYWQTMNVQKISLTGSELYQQDSSGSTGYFFQSAEDGEVAQRDDIWFQNCTLFSVLAPRREIGMEAHSPSGKVCWICGKAVGCVGILRGGVRRTRLESSFQHSTNPARSSDPSKPKGTRPRIVADALGFDSSVVKGYVRCSDDD